MTVQSAMPHVDREPEIRARGMASRVARWALVAYFVVGIAFLLLRHVVLPGADAFRGPIAEALTRSLGVEFGIGRVVADWQGLSPVLRLADVTIHDLSQRSALRLSAVEAALSWRSLLRGRPEFAYLSIVEPELDVRRESDGRLMIAGFEVSAGGGNGGLGSWLLEQPEIRIVDATLVWTDGQRKVPPLVLEHMNLRLQNADGRHRFGLVASPPKAYASMVDLRGEFAAIDGRDWQDLRGKFFVRLERADLGAWQNWVTYPVPLDGSGGASAWIELEGAGRYAGRVDLSLRDARTRLRADLPELAVQRLEGTLLARREGRRVLVETRGLRLDGERLDVPDLDAHVEFLPHTDDETGHGSVRARHLDIGALAALAAHLPFEPRLLAQLAGHSPAGQVFDLEYDWQGAEVAPGLWRLKGRAEGVTIAAGNGWPGVEGVSGHFSGDQDGGEFAVEGRQVGIALPEIFPEPRIQLDQLSLDGRWGRRDGRLEIGVEQARFDRRSRQRVEQQGDALPAQGKIEWDDRIGRRHREAERQFLAPLATDERPDGRHGRRAGNIAGGKQAGHRHRQQVCGLARTPDLLQRGRRRDETIFRHEQRPLHIARVRLRADADRQIAIVFDEIDRLVGDDELDPHIRIFLAERGNMWQQRGVEQRVWHHYAQDAGRRVVMNDRQRFRLLDRRKAARGGLIDLASDFRHRQAARGAVEQCDAEPRLEFLYLAADRARRQAELARRADEALAVDDGDEYQQIVELLHCGHRTPAARSPAISCAS